MPDTIVLIHGFWVTPRSWEDWKARYEARGYKVLTPAYPGLEVEVEALNEDPTPLEQLTVPAIIEHLEEVVGEPRARRRSSWATRRAACSRSCCSTRATAPRRSRSTRRRPRASSACRWRRCRATFPVLKNPANRHRAVGFTHDQWHYAFTNGFSEEESRRLYERYHIPASGNIFWGSALANIHPGKDDTWVDYHNDARAPLLFVSGSDDHLMPPSIQQSNAKHYKSDTITEVKEFEGPHLLPVAARAGRTSPTTRSTGPSATPGSRARREAHPHRRPHRPDRGGRLAAAHRPDLRSRRRQVPLQLGDRVAEAGGAVGGGRATSGRSTRSCSPTTTTTTTSTPPAARCCRRRAWWSRPPRGRSGWAATPAGSSRGRPRAWRPRAGRRSRSWRRRAATVRRAASRSSAT